MFNEVQIVNGIKAFQVGEFLCYLQVGKGIICSNGFEYTTDADGSLYLIGNKLIKQSYRGQLQVFDVAKKERIFENNLNEYKIFIDPNTSLIEDSAIYATLKVNQNEEFGVFDFNSKSFKSKGKEIGISVPGLQIGLNWGGELSSLSVVDFNGDEIAWSIDNFGGYLDSSNKQQKDGISNFLGYYERDLWFGLSSGKNIAINIDNKKIQHQIGFKETHSPLFPHEIKEKSILPYGEFVQLDNQKKEIIGLRDNYFIKIDLQQINQGRKYYDVSQTMVGNKITASYRNYAYPIDDRFIYFCDDRLGKIGVFHREKLEVIWSSELLMERGGIAQILEMKYMNEKWFVLDRNETLHIFERNHSGLM